MPMVVVHDTVLAYTESDPASGTPVVVSHSLFLDHTMFDDLAAFFCGRGFRVIAYAHRNHDRSARAAWVDLDMDTLTDDSAGLIERLRLEPCHFVGNSLGVFVALRLAARRPDLLLTVCGLGSSVEAEARAEDARFRAPRRRLNYRRSTYGTSSRFSRCLSSTNKSLGTLSPFDLLKPHKMEGTSSCVVDVKLRISSSSVRDRLEALLPDACSKRAAAST
jgi:pimeloyl-ACP methyl ester carboxylesterase